MSLPITEMKECFLRLKFTADKFITLPGAMQKDVFASLMEKENITPLHLAIFSKNLEYMAQLLKNEPSWIYSSDKQQLPPFVYAFLMEDIAIFKLFLMNKNFDPNTKFKFNSEEYSLMQLGAQLGDYKKVELLLQANAKIDSDRSVMSALELAKMYRHDRVVKSIESRIETCTLELVNAVKHKDLKAIWKKLKEPEAINFDFQDADSKNILHHACETNDIDIIECIINFHPNLLSRVDRSHKLPFQYCSDTSVKLNVLAKTLADISLDHTQRVKVNLREISLPMLSDKHSEIASVASLDSPSFMEPLKDQISIQVDFTFKPPAPLPHHRQTATTLQGKKRSRENVFGNPQENMVKKYKIGKSLPYDTPKNDPNENNTVLSKKFS